MDKLYRKHRNCPTVIGPGAGPHAYRLICTRHNKTLRWLNNAQADLLFPGRTDFNNIKTNNDIKTFKMRTGRSA